MTEDHVQPDVANADETTDETTRGIIYVGIGDQYIREAIVSAQSVKKYHPELHITLFTDATVDAQIFDEIIVRDDFRKDTSDKILAMMETPYAHTLFLDSDTYIGHPFEDMYALLTHFDVAVAHELPGPPNRATFELNEYLELQVPNSFPEFNTGVLLFRQSAAFTTLCEQWIEEYLMIEPQIARLTDQPVFRTMLFHSSLRVATLPPEYHYRYLHGMYMSGTGLSGPVRILHTRALTPDLLEQACQQLNLPMHKRVIVGRKIFEIDKVGRTTWRDTVSHKPPPPGIRTLWSYTTLLLELGFVEFTRHIVKLIRRRFKI